MGLILFDLIYSTAGYFCHACRRFQFTKHLGLTLVLGWWGVIACLFRNPYAIYVNLRALSAAPIDTGELGAINIDDIRHEASDQQHHADVLPDLPSWFEQLEEGEVELVLTERDYYGTLNIASTATPEEIKAAWRRQVKRYHPDLTRASTSDKLVEVNDAYRVLGDERLRHAYDHRHELLAVLGQRHDDDVTEEYDLTDYDYGCGLCRTAFLTFDDFADHVDTEHPHIDYVEALVELQDGVPRDSDSLGEELPQRLWRCKACLEVFDDYDAALTHADSAHPERVAVDIRTAVEPA